MRIEPLGDSALLVRVADDPEKASDAVLRALDALEVAAIPGVIELAPAYTTIGVFFNAAGIAQDDGDSSGFEALSKRIEQAIQIGSKVEPPRAAWTRPVHEVPICYDDEFAPDLVEVGRQAGLSNEEVIRLHSSATYRVACVGFTPGFPYLSGLAEELAIPRRATPRKEIAAGAVAIGGRQTGIYPRKSPGGWNIIGRTPLRLFDVRQNPPALFHLGDRVLFRKISRQEFAEFQA